MRLIVLFFPLLLSGCATLSEGECQGANWEHIGYEDGSRGTLPTRSSDHAEACAKHGIKVDKDAWYVGYEQGLDAYCTPENAVQVGLAGGDYRGVCPADIEVEFARNHRAARVVYDQRKRVEELDNRRRTLEYALADANNDDERYRIRNELGRLDNELRNERSRLMYEEDRLNRFLNGIR